MRVLLAFSSVSFLLIAALATSAQVNNAESAPSHKSHASVAKLTGDMQKDMQTMNLMMVEHLGDSDSEYDARFIDMMIPHHEGAILMAKDALKNSTHPEIKDLAATIIKAQQKEIEQLKKWRKEWYRNSSKTEQSKGTSR